MSIDASASKKRNRGLRAVIIWFLVFVAAMAAIVLTANGNRNLDRLLAFLGYRFPVAQTATPVAKVSRPPTLVGLSVRVPAGMLMPESILPLGSFDRSRFFAAADFCAILNAALGQDMLQWQRSALFREESECMGGLPKDAAYDGASHNSLFVQVRRNGRNETSIVRIKLVEVANSKDDSYRPLMDRAVAAILDGLHWNDLDDLKAKVSALQPFTEQRYGMEVKLSREVTAPDAYNLTITAWHIDQAQRLSETYFDSSKWLCYDPTLLNPRPFLPGF